MYILPFIIIALYRYTSIAGGGSKEVSDSNTHTAEDNGNDQGKLVMGSFVNRQGIMIRTYASRVDNPKGHIILVHGVCTHFRSSFCRYNAEWYAENATEIINSDPKYFFNGELEDIFPDLTSLKKDGAVYDDPLHGKNAFDRAPRFLYERSFVSVLNRLGYSVYGLDLQSHGLSGGVCKQRSYFHKFDDFVYDVMQFVSIVKRGIFDDPNEKWDEQVVFSDQRHDNLPYYLIGLSMGGNIVLKSQLLFDLNTNGQGKFIDNMICMSSMLNVDLLGTRFNRLLYPLLWLYSIVAPRSKIPIEIMGSSGKAFRIFISYFDPLYYSKRIPSWTLISVYNATKDLRTKMDHYPKDLPTLFIHSKDDSYCSIEGPREYINTFFKDSHVVKLVELNGKSHFVTMLSHLPLIKTILKEWFNIP